VSPASGPVSASVRGIVLDSLSVGVLGPGLPHLFIFGGLTRAHEKCLLPTETMRWKCSISYAVIRWREYLGNAPHLGHKIVVNILNLFVQAELSIVCVASLCTNSVRNGGPALSG